jgi:hypothetical protein
VQAPTSLMFCRPCGPEPLEQINARCHQVVEMTVRDDDLPLIDAVTMAGFEATDEAGVATWMPATERPAVAPLANGFELVARSDVGSGHTT